MPSSVSIWTASAAGRRAGWTLSSFLVADGEPAEVVGLLDEDSTLADLLAPGHATSEPVEGRLVVNLLGWPHRGLADAFAGLAPAPGGVFKLGSWQESAWGPVLLDAPAWLGARVLTPTTHAGWGLLVRAVVEHVAIGPDPEGGMLAHLRGRYRPLA